MEPRRLVHGVGSIARPTECGARVGPVEREKAMIPRYTRPEMAAIWTPESRFRIWFEIEAHAAMAMADIGVIPESPR